MDARDIERLVAKAKDDILKEVNDRLPRKVGVVAVNHFKQNFRDGGWLDNGLHPWKRTRRQDSNSLDAKYGPLTSRRNHMMRSVQAELLMRSKYLLMVSPEKWTPSQRERAEILFGLYPDIETAYSLTHSLRMIFAQRCDKEAGRKSIQKWYAKVGDFDNKAFNDIAAAMYDREDEILNYFVNRSTNASAESLNAKIKDFRAQLRGVIDKKFFIFMLVKIFG